MTMQTNTRRPILVDRIVEAADLIDARFRNTPVRQSDMIDAAVGCSVLLKDETVSPIRSFKARGAEYYIATSRSTDSCEVVSASTGNFGQALAWAVGSRGGRITIFVPEGANRDNVARMREFGAKVEFHGVDFEDAYAEALRYVAREQLEYVDDTRHPQFSEGAGTIAKELTEQGYEFSRIYVPIGGGVLLNGVGTWLRHRRPECKVIGVCAEGAPAMQLSWQKGELVETPSVDTIADGIALRCPSASMLAALKHNVDDIMLVSDEEIRTAMRLLFKATGIAAEPSGAAALAAARKKGGTSDDKIAVLISGGNLTDDQKSAWLTS